MHVVLAVALAFLAPAAQTVPPASSDNVVVSASDLSDDCAIIAAVAKKHFGFGVDNPPPPVRFPEGYDPGCDWSRYGLAFTPYKDDPTAGGRVQPWVRFAPPRYDADGAVIEVGVIYGRLSGHGARCHVTSGFAGWIVTGCTRTWAS